MRRPEATLRSGTSGSPRIYTDYLREASGLAESDLKAIELFGAKRLREGLVDLGRKSSGARVDWIGIGYGKAGAVLRLASRL